MFLSLLERPSTSSRTARPSLPRTISWARAWLTASSRRFWAVANLLSTVIDFSPPNVMLRLRRTAQLTARPAFNGFTSRQDVMAGRVHFSDSLGPIHHHLRLRSVTIKERSVCETL